MQALRICVLLLHTYLNANSNVNLKLRGYHVSALLGVRTPHRLASVSHLVLRRFPMLRPTDALPTYLRDYRETRHSHDHDLLGVFRAARRLIGAPDTVYPGSYVHLSPSLVFPRVCYVDSVKGFGVAMQSDDLIAWLDAHKEYAEPAAVWAVETAYDRIPSTLFARFGLMVSLNAGAVSQECKHLLTPGAHLLVTTATTTRPAPTSTATTRLWRSSAPTALSKRARKSCASTSSASRGSR